MRISIKWDEILTFIRVSLVNVKHIYVGPLIFVFVMGIVSQSLPGKEIKVNENSIVVDVCMIAGNESTAPPTPEQYTLIGYWDVDDGGSQGTDGSTGHYMMGFYATKNCGNPSSSGKTYLSNLILMPNKGTVMKKENFACPQRYIGEPKVKYSIS
jgi:hypothetical protein